MMKLAIQINNLHTKNNMLLYVVDMLQIAAFNNSFSKKRYN